MIHPRMGRGSHCWTDWDSFFRFRGLAHRPPNQLRKILWWSVEGFGVRGGQQTWGSPISKFCGPSLTRFCVIDLCLTINKKFNRACTRSVVYKITVISSKHSVEITRSCIELLCSLFAHVVGCHHISLCLGSRPLITVIARAPAAVYDLSVVILIRVSHWAEHSGIVDGWVALGRTVGLQTWRFNFPQTSGKNVGPLLSANHWTFVVRFFYSASKRACVTASQSSPVAELVSCHRSYDFNAPVGVSVAPATGKKFIIVHGELYIKIIVYIHHSFWSLKLFRDSVIA